MAPGFWTYFVVIVFPLAAVALAWRGALYYLAHEEALQSRERTQISDGLALHWLGGILLLMVVWYFSVAFMDLATEFQRTVRISSIFLVFTPLPLEVYFFRPLARRWVGRRKAPA